MCLPAYNSVLPPNTLPSITSEDVDVDIHDHWIWTVRNIGAQARLDLLLAYGATPKPHGRKRLLRALMEINDLNMFENLKFLIELGPDIFSPYVWNIQASTVISKVPSESWYLGLEALNPISPLCWAILHGHKIPLDVLLDAGALEHETGSYPPLHLAVFVGSSKSFQMLIEHGADTKIEDTNGLDLMQFVVKHCEYMATSMYMRRILYHHEPRYWELRGGLHQKDIQAVVSKLGKDTTQSLWM